MRQYPEWSELLEKHKKIKKSEKYLQFHKNSAILNKLKRCVAQFGRALRSGRRGRRFKSCRIDSLAGAPEALRDQSFRSFFSRKQ